MNRLVAAAVLALVSGCSNAPIAGFLDSCFPGKAPERSREPVAPGDRIPAPDLGAPVGPKLP